MRLKFITLAMLSRCCSHCHCFVLVRPWEMFPSLCGSCDVRMELWFLLLENTGSCCFSMALGALGTLLWAGSQEEEAPFLHNTWSSSLTESKNFWFCGCCSLVLLQWAAPHSPAWNVPGEVLADLFRCVFSQQRHVCLFCEGILCGSSPEAMDIVSLISIRILQNLHLAPSTHCSH